MPFLFITCQIGAEGAVKAELARQWPDFRFAYSRPGFLTFKLPEGQELADDFPLRSVFARAYGFSLGKAVGTSDDERAQRVWQAVERRGFEQLHVWPRDTAAPGDHGYEPGLTPAAVAADEALRRHAPADALIGEHTRPPARQRQLVLDCVLVAADEWWFGYHRARSFTSRWPGGLSNLELPADAVSRAYLKMAEALAWSRLPLRPGDTCAEIGCAPGGASQCLLRHGLRVLGVDPAAMPEELLSNPNFAHLRKRGSEVRRREFRGVRWLMADMNVAPSYTLDTVEAIVTHQATNVRGLLLTLKLPSWDLAAEVPSYVRRVRGWGYARVRARQLQFNRQEICLAATRG